MQARMEAWSRLSPQERGQARLRYQQAQTVPPQERRERWEQYQALPADQAAPVVGRLGQGRGSAQARGAANGTAPRGFGRDAAQAKSNLVPSTALGRAAEGRCADHRAGQAGRDDEPDLAARPSRPTISRRACRRSPRRPVWSIARPCCRSASRKTRRPRPAPASPTRSDERRRTRRRQRRARHAGPGAAPGVLRLRRRAAVRRADDLGLPLLEPVAATQRPARAPRPAGLPLRRARHLFRLVLVARRADRGDEGLARPAARARRRAADAGARLGPLSARLGLVHAGPACALARRFERSRHDRHCAARRRARLCRAGDGSTATGSSCTTACAARGWSTGGSMRPHATGLAAQGKIALHDDPSAQGPCRARPRAARHGLFHRRAEDGLPRRERVPPGGLPRRRHAAGGVHPRRDLDRGRAAGRLGAAGADRRAAQLGHRGRDRPRLARVCTTCPSAPRTWPARPCSCRSCCAPASGSPRCWHRFG